ncbi:2-amino-4-hydroxy-6-hydroxymethyldihydropteridine diphosphokinase [Gallaecimonas kandeliae]|uniref:2-amino-4-hydroxy-6- hydroxymethyldihydropteridine diphosphokinase n=1 Tax=Gallaecimonas kandeliae TaxID=3029055 RepID=UPI00264854B4|nr:2-amino-4-hydroxy-6-hydroxymethyldihydropteridine diphosphokinase [Gallaecimonas kandeliae]WKE64763.1 2-amino-4-hydroxy-6-hydroxymethyldihydropteridine diphosphokinase [Gallaecimonas kandeliae]
MTEILLSLGSNVSPEQHLRAGLKALRAAFGEIACSPVFEAEPIGFKGTNFLNMAVRAWTDWPLEAVLAWIKDVEFAHGRPANAKKYAPRTLDIDLLTFGDLVCQEPVELPRPDIRKLAFVLWPLAELVPEQLLPGSAQSYRQLWSDFPKTQALWPVPFEG